MTRPVRGGAAPAVRPVVVVGGANMDVKARSSRTVVAGTSNPGSTVLAPGGVGRNVAENLARLGTPTALVAALGSDPLGDLVLAATGSVGVDVAAVRRVAGATGTYTAVLDDAGELVVAVSDMAATDGLAPEDLPVDLLAGARLLVLDGNLAPATLGRALEVATAAGVPVVLEPVSVPKAAVAGRLLDGSHPVLLVTPNRDELTALAGLPTGTPAPDAVELLHERGVEHVWVRQGTEGSLLSGPGGVTRLAHVPAPLPEGVVDVTGAGDAMLAAFCHCLLAGADPAAAAAYGHAAAALTVADPHTVRPDLTDQLVRSLLP